MDETSQRVTKDVAREMSTQVRGASGGVESGDSQIKLLCSESSF